jgi:two-component system, NarL family, sensor histidine kinase UhpB
MFNQHVIFIWNKLNKKIMEYMNQEQLRIPVIFLIVLVAAGLLFFFGVEYYLDVKQSTSGQDILILCSIFGLASMFFLFLSLSGWYKTRIKKEKQEIANELLRYESLSNATNDAIWDYDIATGETYYNNHLLVTFGYKAEDVKDNMTWWRNNIHPDDRERVISAIEQKLKGEVNTWQDDYRFRHQNGTYRNVYDRCYILRDDRQQPIRLIGSMVDITERRNKNEDMVNMLLEKKNKSGQQILELFEQKQKQIRTQLHEDVAQDLAALKFTLSAKKGKGEKDVISQSIDHLNSSIQKIRNLSGNIYPATIEKFNLQDAIKDLITKTENSTKLKIDFFVDDQLALHRYNKSSSYLLYRIIELQVQNITVHAGANTAMIELHHEPDNKLCLVVSDDGKGTDRETIQEGTGFAEMKSSIEMYNGSLNFITAKDKGFTLEVII